MRPGQGPLAATSGGSRPRESPAPGRQRRLGRGASGHAPAAPSGAERSRARPSAAEPSRAARSRLVQLRPRRSAVRGSGVVAAAAASAGLSRPAGHPPGRRPGAWGERHGRGRRRRRCQVSARRGPPAPRAPATVSPRVCVSLCLSAPCVCAGSFPPRLSPGAARSVRQPLPPAAPGLSVSRQRPHAGRLRPFPPKPRPSPICHHPRPQLQARASWGSGVPQLLGVSVAPRGPRSCEWGNKGVMEGGPQMST